MRRLVLFDIDGTLLSSDGVAARAFRSALEEVFGTSGPTEGYSFAGRTDLQIAQELLGAAGIGADEIERGISRTVDLYLGGLAAGLKHRRATVFPGVREILDRVEAAPEEAVLGLLTGNVREGARIKLDSAGLNADRFTVGAYGSDHAQRSELPALAVQRAEARYGRRFEGKEVVIIGDTPLDIACGEHLGVRTIAVATGNYSMEDLERCGPDHVFPTLENTDRVWQAIFG